MPATHRINLSRKAENYIRKTFSDRLIGPEKIMKIIGDTEEKELAFVSRFFNAGLPKPAVRYVMGEEVNGGRNKGYGLMDEKTLEITHFVDAIFKTSLHFAMEIEFQFAVFQTHEFLHLHDLLHTPLFEAKHEIYGRVDALVAEAEHKGSLRRLLRRIRKSPELLAALERKGIIDAVLEGRAERAAWLSLEEKLAQSTSCEDVDSNRYYDAAFGTSTSCPLSRRKMDAFYYIRAISNWDGERALFIEHLENKFGRAKTWEATGKILPLSMQEIEMPGLYLARISAI